MMLKEWTRVRVDLLYDHGEAVIMTADKRKKISELEMPTLYVFKIEEVLVVLTA
jgi:hypothetical protein